MNYYNDNDKNAVKWIKYLIKNKLIPEGEVDDRSIKDVNPNDLRGFIQCHFFAGICGWSSALQLAAWPDNKPVWTGSCPCQPFSVAGRGKAEKDERHLWPYFRQLIKESSPQYVFGEQVASKLGREWLSGVQTDMEAMGFAFGAADIPACSVGAPHIRQRLWWVAHAKGKRRHGTAAMPEQDRGGESETGCELGNADSQRSQKRTGNGRLQPESNGANPWEAFKLANCRDGKQRRIPEAQSAFPIVAHGLPGRVALLRGIGNSIVPRVAAEFIKAFLRC